MSQDFFLGVIILLGILSLSLNGGIKNAQFAKAPVSENQTIEYKIQDAKKQIELTEIEKTRSKYYGIVTLQYVTRSDNANQEYLTLRVSDGATTTVPITGWRLSSENSGVQVAIPKSTKLFFADSQNAEEDIVLTPKDTVYIVTGRSPNGSGMKVNKCSGYLEQFQDFTPYLWSSCPAPRTEDLSSIPKRTVNDACFDYIEYMPSCRIQTDPLPANWSYECTNFITTKINYPTCVSVHKNDSDFYTHEWRVYLKRSEPLWKSRRESIVLTDLNGKVVSKLQY